MSNEALELLELFQSGLGSTRAKCDDGGKKLWDRVEAVKLATLDAQLYAEQLDAAVMEVLNGERKAAKLPVEPMVRLIHFARTSSVKNAKVGGAAMTDRQWRTGAYCIHRETNSSVLIDDANDTHIYYSGVEVNGCACLHRADEALELVKPCPFCGEHKIDPEEWTDQDGKQGPACPTCDAHGASVEAWNRRATDGVGASDSKTISRK